MINTQVQVMIRAMSALPEQVARLQASLARLGAAIDADDRRAEARRVHTLYRHRKGARW